MRVALMHNKSAGSEDHAADEIAACVRRAGHEVVALATEVRELVRKVSERTCELVVVAGGDGTVSRVACALAGKRVPLAILPLGTANNTAMSLGFEGDVEKLVAEWKHAAPRDYDLATISVKGGTPTPFSEAVGWGAFPNLMARTERMSLPEQREHTLERDRKLFGEEIERAKLRAYEIEVDGTLVRGEFLLVELVNIPLIGPQVELSPESDPGDGHFELVLAGQPERKALMELASGTSGTSGRLPTRRVKQLILRSACDRFHRDGSLVELADPSEFSVTIEPASVRFLLAR